MAKVRIYRPTKSATQSGVTKTRYWLMEYEHDSQGKRDSLTGWRGYNPTTEQVKLRFPSMKKAIEYAQEKGLEYTVDTPQRRQMGIRPYSQNFSKPR